MQLASMRAAMPSNGSLERLPVILHDQEATQIARVFAMATTES